MSGITSTRRDGSLSSLHVTETIRVERRKKRREMHLDRRKSDIDVIEHVALGVRWNPTNATVDDRPPRRHK